MLHCACSARALELFIKQVAGFSVKRPCQTIRSRKPLQPHSLARSFQTDIVKVTDDAYIPFETATRRERLIEHSVDKIERKGLYKEGDNADDWHAEMNIRSSTHATSVSAADAEAQSENHRRTTVDAVDLRSLHPTISPAQTHRSSIPAITDSRIEMMQQPPIESQRSETRKLRKSRRIEEGRYRPKAQEVQSQKSTGTEANNAEASQTPSQAESQRTDHADASQGAVVDTLAETGQVTSVLDLIEGLEGPMVKLEPPKKNDPESHKAAKKLRYDQMLAQKALAKEKAHIVEKALALKRQKDKEPWQIQKAALERKFGEDGWSPRKRLSPDTLEGIRAIHASDPTTYTTKTLSEHFKIAPEAVRRILKSKWKPNEDEVIDRRVRWERRGIKKWEALASQGVKPPAKWRALGVGSEMGTSPERVPRRNLRGRGDGFGELSWDEVVADMEDGEVDVAARIL